MRIIDWSSDVCSSDLVEQRVDLRRERRHVLGVGQHRQVEFGFMRGVAAEGLEQLVAFKAHVAGAGEQPRSHGLHLRVGVQHAADVAEASVQLGVEQRFGRRAVVAADRLAVEVDDRSEEHTSELQSLMRTSYAVFCLKKKKQT